MSDQSNKQFYEGLVQKGKPGQAIPGQPNAPVLVKYYNTITPYDTNNWVDSDCAEIAFLNVGDGNFPTPAGADVIVLGFTIKAGFGISFDGEECELDVTKYQIVFSGNGVRNCSVFRKMYV